MKMIRAIEMVEETSRCVFLRRTTDNEPYHVVVQCFGASARLFLDMKQVLPGRVCALYNSM